MSKISGIHPKTGTEYIEEIYEFAGQWDTPSKCGLLIRKHSDIHVVIASELYDDNPGTSVNYFSARLATRICQERALDPDKLIFIEHTPDRGSNLEIYKETFDRVSFEMEDGKLVRPDWSSLTREQADAIIAGFSPVPQ